MWSLRLAVSILFTILLVLSLSVVCALDTSGVVTLGQGDLLIFNYTASPLNVTVTVKSGVYTDAYAHVMIVSTMCVWLRNSTWSGLYCNYTNLRGTVLLSPGTYSYEITLLNVDNVYYVFADGHNFTMCSRGDEKCMFMFYEGPVNLLVNVYNTTMEVMYSTLLARHVYGMNITSPWFSDKLLLFNRTVLWNYELARDLNITLIDVSAHRWKMILYVTFEQSATSTYRAPLLILCYEHVNASPVWGQLALLHAVSYLTATQLEITLPVSWYDTYGIVYMRSLVTGATYVVKPVQFTDYVSITVTSERQVMGSITVTTPSGEKLRIVPPVVTVPSSTSLLDIRPGTPQFLILVGLGFAIWIFAMKREIDQWTALAVGGFMIAGIGLLLGVMPLFYAGLGMAIIGIVMRIGTRYASR